MTACSRTELLVPEPAQALAGLLDIDLPPGGELPPLWHWVYLLERRRQDELGPDGHPMTGVPAPPAPGRLRMFAGGRVLLQVPLRLGGTATRSTRVLRTVDKQGRSGPLTFVTVRSEIEQDGRLAVVDEQDIVYRPPDRPLPFPGGGHALPAPTAGHRPSRTELALDVDPVLLFRFSALTYNAHRIHYDLGYAQQEGYPDLVVHGPLQALLMGEAFRRTGGLHRGSEFAYRLVAPTFGAQRLTVSTADGAAELYDGAGTMTATSTLRPAA